MRSIGPEINNSTCESRSQERCQFSLEEKMCIARADTDAPETTRRRPNRTVGAGSHGVRADPPTRQDRSTDETGAPRPHRNAPSTRPTAARHLTLPLPYGTTRLTGRRSAGYDRTAPLRLPLRREETGDRPGLVLRHLVRYASFGRSLAQVSLKPSEERPHDLNRGKHPPPSLGRRGTSKRGWARILGWKVSGPPRGRP
jgi:hypothetical protein